MKESHAKIANMCKCIQTIGRKRLLRTQILPRYTSSSTNQRPRLSHQQPASSCVTPSLPILCRRGARGQQLSSGSSSEGTRTGSAGHRTEPATSDPADISITRHRRDNGRVHERPLSLRPSLITAIVVPLKPLI